MPPGVKRKRRESGSDDEVVQTSDGGEMTAGYITKIKLTDFMCHHEFTWKPKEINFLIGENGSGKSSILQGIVLGLLGKSKATSRFTKLGDFVRTDCQKSVIEISLCNEGEDAWDPETYGKTIIVQRTIYASRANKLSLQSWKGETVFQEEKKARDELSRILHKFNIFIDNPLVILQQEVAKSMLNDLKPEKMFTFIMKATMLEEIRSWYQEADNELHKLRAKYKEKDKSLKDLKNHAKELQEKTREDNAKMEKNQEFSKTVKDLSWKKLYLLKRDLTDKELELENAEKRRDYVHEELILQHKKNKEIMDRMKELEESIRGESEECKKDELELNILREDERKIKIKMKETESLIRDLEKDKQDKKQYRDLLRVEVQNPDKLLELRVRKERFDQEDLKINLEISESKEAVEACSRIKDEKEEELDICNKNIKVANISREDLKRKLTEAQSTQQRLMDLENRRLAPYGREMINLDKLINNFKTTFSKLPIGPVGRHIRLKENADDESLDKKTALIIESLIGQDGFRAYLVNNYEDSKTLRGLINQAFGSRIKPKVHITTFLSTRHDALKNYCVPATRYPALINCLAIDKTEVFNHLVDQFKLESIIACPTQEQAKSISTREENVPSGVSMVVSLDGYKFIPPKNNLSYRSYYMDVKKTLDFLDNSPILENKKNIEHIERDLQNQDAKGRGLVARATKIQDEIKKIRDEINQKKEVWNQMRKNKTEHFTENSRLISQLKELERGPEETDSLDKLDQEITALTNRCLELTVEKEKLTVDLDTVVLKKNKRIASLAKIRENNQGLVRMETDLEQLRIEKAMNEKTRDQLTAFEKGKKTQVEKLKKEKSVCFDKLKEGLESLRNKYGEEDMPEPEETFEKLRAKLDMLKAAKSVSSDTIMEKFKKQKGCSAKFSNYTFKELHQMIATKSKNLNDLKKNIEILESQAWDRKMQMVIVRRCIVHMAVRNFNILAQDFNLGFEGRMKLTIDISTRTANIKFRNEENEVIYQDLDTLSGGEKSYAQMCLIVSMWNVVRTPFRALDEWDVYLDPVNRKQISAELLKAALKQKEVGQFFFISPQGATDIHLLDRTDRSRIEIREIKK